ncbi:MAG: hypothetical protein D3917_12075 [Candidatus Electrothrix sp. AX5]|nr:hypothetical protein [Candidatus Electrothrix sp. AX5]
MVKFLTTQGVNYYLECMLKNAKKQIVLVSPYIQLQRRIKEILLEKKKQGVKIIIVCRTDDIKEPIADFAHEIYNAPTLHAKCYMNENSAIVTSLNLYEFSQQNNEEMGFFIKKENIDEAIYSEIKLEVSRLINSNSTSVLKEGVKYSEDKLENIFNFEYKGRAGIKKAGNGEIVLFSSVHDSPYEDTEEGGVIYYQGQNTGIGDQKLIYGNKNLYSAYKEKNIKIHFFKGYLYSGSYKIISEPYMENGKWIFPLTKEG